MKEALGVVGGALVAAACATATGDLEGGGTAAWYDGSAPSFRLPAEDEGSGTKWSDLYRDLFGPAARGSCTNGARCHGTPDAEGAKIPGGLQCFDSQRCYRSMRDLNLVKPEDAAAPENSILLARILRIQNAQGTITGFMPEAPQAYVFSPTAVERIKTWIRDGSKDE